MSDYIDKELECVACKLPFVWTGGEQKFMQRLVDDGKISVINQPKRCPDCRAAKKAKFPEGQEGRNY